MNLFNTIKKGKIRATKLFFVDAVLHKSPLQKQAWAWAPL